jgi:hypothetical protein
VLNFVICGALFVAVTGNKAGWVRHPGADVQTSRHSMRELGRLPLQFVENRGQVDREVAYYVQRRDKGLFFTQEGITFALGTPPSQTRVARVSDRRDRDHSPAVATLAFCAGTAKSADLNPAAQKLEGTWWLGKRVVAQPASD